MKTANCLTDEILDVIIDMNEKGFDHDFVLDGQRICCLQLGETIIADDFEILEIYCCRHLFYKQPKCILFGIQLTKYSVKGILMISLKSVVGEVTLQLSKKLHLETGGQAIKTILLH